MRSDRGLPRGTIRLRPSKSRHAIVVPRMGLNGYVELKTPFVGKITTSRSDGNRAKFCADADSFISQTIEYRDSIRENNESRSIAAKAFNVDTIKSSKPLIIYGMERDNDWPLVTKLADERSSIEILAFDLLLYKMIEQYSRDREFVIEAKSGFCMVLHFLVESTSDDEVALISAGNSDTGRMELLIRHDKVIGRAYKKEHFSIEVSASITLNHPTFAAFEFSTGSEGHHSLLLVDNRLANCNFSENDCLIDIDDNTYEIGLRKSKCENTSIAVFEHYFTKSTFDITILPTPINDTFPLHHIFGMI